MEKNKLWLCNNLRLKLSQQKLTCKTGRYFVLQHVQDSTLRYNLCMFAIFGHGAFEKPLSPELTGTSGVTEYVATTTVFCTVRHVSVLFKNSHDNFRQIHCFLALSP